MGLWDDGTMGLWDYGTMRDYKKIEAWKLADDLTVRVYRVTAQFPREELFGMVSQLRRAAYSVPSNIAEGATRESSKDYLRFLIIARSSLAETEYFLHLAARLSYLTPEEHSELVAETNRTFACLHGLIRAVEKDSGLLGRVITVLAAALLIGLSKVSSSP